MVYRKLLLRCYFLFRKKEKKPKRKKEKKSDEKKSQKIPDKIDLNAYNLLFDELNALFNELPHISPKSLKQRLILIDGKMLWLEKYSDQDILLEEESDDIIELEMEMLEMGLDLESADEMKSSYEAMPDDFDIEAVKNDLQKTKSWGEDLKDLIKDIEEDSTGEVEGLTSKLLLYDLRAIMEGAIKIVFTLEGKIKQIKNDPNEKDKVKALQEEQKKNTKRYLNDIIAKLKKEKPQLILPEKLINEFKNLTQKHIAELKKKEEQVLDDLVNELLEE